MNETPMLCWQTSKSQLFEKVHQFFLEDIYHYIKERKKMCVLLPKVLIFISLGRRVPVDIKRGKTNLNTLQETMVPDLQTAEGIYQSLFRGRFTNFHSFGTDALENNRVQCRNRDNRFYSSFQICDIFSELTNNRNTLFQRALLYYINETKRLDV